MKFTLYIYDVETGEVVHSVRAETNEQCQALADAANWDRDQYGWTYFTPDDRGLIDVRSLENAFAE